MIELHTTRVRVYYEDTDAGGIVYHANYLRYFERARSDWLRVHGVQQRALATTTGIGFVVRDCAVRFIRPARLDDELDVRVLVEDAGRDVRRASLTLVQHADICPPDDRSQPPSPRPAVASRSAGAMNGEAVQAATARITLAAIRLDTGRPVPLPADVLRAIQATP